MMFNISLITEIIRKGYQTPKSLTHTGVRNTQNHKDVYFISSNSNRKNSKTVLSISN